MNVSGPPGGKWWMTNFTASKLTGGWPYCTCAGFLDAPIYWKAQSLKKCLFCHLLGCMWACARRMQSKTDGEDFCKDKKTQWRPSFLFNYLELKKEAIVSTCFLWSPNVLEEWMTYLYSNPCRIAGNGNEYLLMYFDSLWTSKLNVKLLTKARFLSSQIYIFPF